MSDQVAETWCFHPEHEHGVDGARLDHCRAARRVVPIAPDPARDARVAARRAAYAALAGRALDKLLGAAQREADRAYAAAWSDGYAEGLQHNRAYGVSPIAAERRACPECGTVTGPFPETHQCTIKPHYGVAGRLRAGIDQSRGAS